MVSLNYAVLNASIIVYITAASVYKSRLCVEYEIANFWAKEEALLVIHGLTRGGCMVQCVHQPICRAFNFRPANGTCRLHPEFIGCMTPNNTDGWLYVSLATCKQHPPWQSMRPADGGWRWISTDNPEARGDLVELSGRFLCRIFYKGLYLPGWWGSWPAPGEFRVSIAHEKRIIRCNIGEFLALLDPSRFYWTRVNMEDAMPTNAVIGGHATDSTPLYIARKLIIFEMMPGFYNAVNKTLYVVYNRYREDPPGDLLSFA